MGLFNTLTNNIKKSKGRNLTLFEKAYCGLTAGFVGSIVGNPADLALVRFQADTLLPKEERRNYRNVGDALTRIIKEEGVLALWKGCSPTIVRAMCLNLGMLATFDEVKEQLNKIRGTKDDLSTKLLASALAGGMASFLTLPPDNIKTKMQRMKPDAQGNVPYSSMLDCFAKSIKREGVTGLWVGLPTFIVRIAPHAMFTLLINDFLNGWAKRNGF